MRTQRASRALIMGVCLAAALGCDNLETNDDESADRGLPSSEPGGEDARSDRALQLPDEFSTDPVLNALRESGDWSRTPNQPTLADADEAPGDEGRDHTRPSEELQALAEADPVWRAPDGRRYEALFVTDLGVAYGRIGPAPEARLPGIENLFGSHTGPGAPVEEEPTEEPDDTQDLFPKIGTPCTTDTRWRSSSSSFLSSFPTRTIGALSGSGNTQSGNCSAVKIGPRAILTASHCVMNAAGNITTTGRFNPGQTNSSALNGSIPRSGVYLRDWRSGTKWDYAVAFLSNTQAVYNLGWMGVQWWNSGSSYSGKYAYLRGYPCGPNNNCGMTTGIDPQCCLASPMANDQCDGWMYSDGGTLSSNAYASNDRLRTSLDQSDGQSGSPIYRNAGGGSWAVLGVVKAINAADNGECFNEDCYGPRFRQNMWDDVCSWIGDNNFQSSWGSHALCP